MLRYSNDAMFLKSCQVSWVEEEEFVNLSVSLNQGEVLVLRTIFKFDEILWHQFEGLPEHFVFWHAFIPCFFPI